MDDTIQNDVNTQSDTSTVTDSSSSQQTPVATDQTSTTSENSSIGAEATGDKTVPYDRFKEVNDSFRQTQAELRALREQQQLVLQQQQQFVQNQMPQQPAEVVQAKQQLKQLLQEVAPELGFVSKQELEQQRTFNEIAQTERSLAEKYNGKDGLPKYDADAVRKYAVEVLGMNSPKGLEVAYKQMHEAEIMNARLQAALKQTRGIQSEQSNGTGSANTGVQDADLKKAAKDGDQNAIHLLLKRRLASK